LKTKNKTDIINQGCTLPDKAIKLTNFSLFSENRTIFLETFSSQAAILLMNSDIVSSPETVFKFFFFETDVFQQYQTGAVCQCPLLFQDKELSIG
jgi:hypothetical protein